jgi:glycosyltransferase involved in cell wall biosynthesis
VPKEVLYVDTPNYVGGAEISLLSLIEGLDPARYIPHLLASGDGALVTRARGAGISTLNQEFPWFSRRHPWRYLCSIVHLVQTIHSRGINLIHTNCDHSLGYVMRASWLTGVPYVSHVRDFTRTWFEPEKLVALNRSSRVIAVSQSVARACVEGGVEPDRVLVVYNPIDVDAFQTACSTSRVKVRKEFGIPTGALVVGIVGLVQPLKGHMEFVEASLRLAMALPGAHFLLVGEPPPGEAYDIFLNKLRERIADSGYEARFHSVGFRTDVPNVMKAIDILAVPSWMEPFGRVAVEGMAAGCAVVGTAAGGLPEIITDGIDGILVPPKDVDALTTALYRLAAQPDLRRVLTKEGACTARRFTAHRHAGQMQALYDSVLSDGDC